MSDGPPITGRTRLIAHVGVPTEGFASPMIYNPWLAERGADAVVVPMGVEAVDFPAFLPPLARMRNFAGALITMPHKRAAARLVDRASDAVRLCGAANAVRRGADGRLEGEMFDGVGFVRALERTGRTLHGASALVVGAGGVGSAIAAALAVQGMRLALHDTDRATAEALAVRLHAHGFTPVVADGPLTTGHDVVVNATPLGMRADDALAFDVDALDARSVVGDVVLGAETALVARARTRGLVVVTGEDMLFEQVPLYLAFLSLPSTDAETLHERARHRAGDA